MGIFWNEKHTTVNKLSVEYTNLGSTQISFYISTWKGSPLEDLIFYNAYTQFLQWNWFQSLGSPKAYLTRFPQTSSISCRDSFAFSTDTQIASQHLVIWSQWPCKYG